MDTEEEIRGLKKTILNMCQNIQKYDGNINYPYNTFSEVDIEYLIDYIGRVVIWIYTTNASTSIVFTSKIHEINEIVNTMIKKYY